MNQHINPIASRLSLRAPQRESLEILARLCELLPLEKETDITKALAALRADFPTVEDFERDFPSMCFALATGVGKTRLMGAFITYLHRAEGIRNFFVLAPNLTIYNKLIADFTPNTPKYVFQGIAEFAVTPPEIITGDNYETGRGVRDEARKQRLLPGMTTDDVVHINIFNISKITSIETPKGAAKTTTPRLRRLQEYIGESYFEYLSKLDDLVLLMDESHRYRASAGMKAIGELKPILGLELTATPQVEKAGGTIPFKNVIFAYPLSSAMTDGFVKEPAVATRENFDASNYDEAGLERLKLEDGLRLHENTKVELEVYARENALPVVKPFMLVIAKDTTHADELLKKMEDSAFFEGRYKGKAIVVHSNLKGEEKDETIEQLINVEKPENPAEIVIHVNMLKEGWDVTNLYTIVPLRTANSKTLVEQSIGRGLRLPYGKRTGVAAVDRLTIVSHDKFQEIVDYANSPDSIIRGGLKVIHITDEKAKPVIAPPELVYRIEQEANGAGAVANQPPLFGTSREREAAKATLEVIRREFERLPRSADLSKPEVQKEIVKRVEEILTPAHPEFSGAGFTVDIKEVVSKTVNLYQELSIDIPRITVQPVGDVHRGYKEFSLDLAKVRLQPVDHEILIQELHKRETHRLTSGSGVVTEKRPEDYIVRGLMDFYDINYDEHSALLYKLAAQVVEHLKSYLTTADDILNVLQYHQQPLASLVHAQMQEHFEEKAVAYEAHVSKGFTTLRTTNYMSSDAGERDVRAPVSEKQDIAKMIFGGFKRCLYRVQKFDSDPERRFAVILETDKEVLKWLRPSKGDFHIYHSAENSYEPDFAVETKTGMLLCEVKRSSEMTDPIVLAKARAATQWCQYATEHARKHGAKPWAYLLIPDTVVTENKTLKALTDAHKFQGA